MGAQDQEDVVFGERRAAYRHHGLIVEPQPFTMGADDALDAYDVAQKETKEAAVTNKKGESTTSVGTSSSAHSSSVGTANSVYKSSVGTAERQSIICCCLFDKAKTAAYKIDVNLIH